MRHIDQRNVALPRSPSEEAGELAIETGVSKSAIKRQPPDFYSNTLFSTSKRGQGQKVKDKGKGKGRGKDLEMPTLCSVSYAWNHPSGKHYQESVLLKPTYIYPYTVIRVFISV